jgi:hypothetical protein
MNRRYLLLLLLLAIAATIIWKLRPIASTSAPQPIAATQPTTYPTTAQVIAPPPIVSYIDVVRSQNPAVPATQPLGVPLDLVDAAHIQLRDPIYLDPLGHLWITRSDAKPTEQSLLQPQDPSEHIIPDTPVFVHWWINDTGDWSAAVVTARPGGFDLITSKDRQPLAGNRPYRWAAAFSWQDKIVVPTDVGVSIFDITPTIQEHYHALAGTNISPPLTTLDAKGLLAWSPWENGKSGSHGVSRFLDGKWTDLAGDSWADKIVQLVPLLDGSILQIIASPSADADKISLSIVPLESSDIDEKHITDLVTQLADPDPDKRQSAFAELSQYGPGLAPLLEKLSTDQPPEARLRLKQLLAGKITPALGGMQVIDNRLAVSHRQDDGTVLLFAPAGVSVPNGSQDALAVTPAWLCIRPGGRVDRALPADLVKGQQPDNCTLHALHDDWTRSDSTGVSRFVGDTFTPLANDNEQRFSQLIGVDRRGRWLLADPSQKNQTLLIDPTILDPTPRLPVWTMKIPDGSTGWDHDDWPTTKRGGAWALKADTWEPLPDTDPMTTTLPPPTSPSTQPTQPLLTTPNGSQFFDGQTALKVIDKSGQTQTWPLPPSAVGDAAPTLIRTTDGTLFLFNQPGRVLRIKPTPAATQPFQLEATFTKDIPASDHPARIWLDPLGRIDFVTDGNILVIMFPSGHIPPEIEKMMPEGN